MTTNKCEKEAIGMEAELREALQDEELRRQIISILEACGLLPAQTGQPD